MRRKVIIPTIALVAILGAVAMGTLPVSAQSTTYSNLVTSIAQRFNLKESDVQDVVNQVKTSRVSAFETKWEDHLTQLVTDGKITGAQKDTIIAKNKDIKSQLDALKGLSPSDRKAKMTQIFADLSAWAKTNNLDFKQLGLFGMRPGFRMGFRIGHGMK